MLLFETKRLTVRPLALEDAPLILEQVNEPCYIKHIGDKDVHCIDDAHRYLKDGPLASYKQHGFGLWRVALKKSDVAIGTAGILKRDYLDHADLGYAVLLKYRGMGYAFEATTAVMAHARKQLGLTKILASVDPENEPSIKLLLKLGFTFERMSQPLSDSPEYKLFAHQVIADCSGYIPKL